jgi:hypothetical protein
MKAVHLICKGTPENKRNGLEPTKIEGDIYASRGWNFSGDEADSLVGGMIYFHRTKANLSFFGGKIKGWEWTVSDDVARPNRIRFIFERKDAGKYQKWRGQDHTRAWTSRIIDI